MLSGTNLTWGKATGPKTKCPECVKTISNWGSGEGIYCKSRPDTLQSLWLLERGPRLEFNYSYRPADFCRRATMASEFEWAESAEVTLLTEVEIQSQLNFCHCSHRAEVTSPSLEYSALLSKDRVPGHQCCRGRIWHEARQQGQNQVPWMCQNNFKFGKRV